MKQLLLVDGNNLGFRGFGVAPLTHEGKRVEAIFVGIKQVLYYMKKFHPDDVVVCWDGGKDERRLMCFPEYKKKRELEEWERLELEEFFRQLGEIQRVFHELGFRQVRIRGREADDVIATLVTRKPLFAHAFDLFTVVSTDHDYYQLLGNREVQIYSPAEGKVVDLPEAQKRLGFEDVKLYPFYKALLGGHDGIPGVNGVGPVAASFFINHSGELRNMWPVRMQNLFQKFLVLEKDVDMWRDISRFYDIEDDEIEGNIRHQAHLNYMDWCRAAMKILDEFGFREFKEGFVDFSSPFRDYYESRGGQNG